MDLKIYQAEKLRGDQRKFVFELIARLAQRPVDLKGVLEICLDDLDGSFNTPKGESVIRIQVNQKVMLVLVNEETEKYRHIPHGKEHRNATPVLISVASAIVSL